MGFTCGSSQEPLKDGLECLGMFGELLPGDTNHSPPKGFEIVVTRAVALPGIWI